MVLVPRADEHVVDAAMMLRLPHHRVDDVAGVGVVDGPRVPGSDAGDLPGVVVMDAAAAE